MLNYRAALAFRTPFETAIRGARDSAVLDPRVPELDLAPPVALKVDVTPRHGIPALTHDARAVERPAVGTLDLPVENDMPVQHRPDACGRPDHIRVGRVRLRRPEFDDEGIPLRRLIRPVDVPAARDIDAVEAPRD